MNKTLLCTVFTAGSLIIGAISPVQAEPGKIDSVIDLLHQAQASTTPTPLLEKAKEELKGFTAKPNQNEMIAGRVGPKKRAAVNLGAHKYKEEAMEAIDKAIEASKAGAAAPVKAPGALGSAMDNTGGDLKAKIDSAIAKVHQAGELKH